VLVTSCSGSDGATPIDSAMCGPSKLEPGPTCPGLASLPCDDEALGALVAEIMETNRAGIIELAATHLRAGRSMDDLLYAAFSAGIRASSFRTHSNHTCKTVEAARQLSVAASGMDRFVPLMWALDSVCPCPDGIQDPRDTGEPMGVLDDSNLPAGMAAADAFEQGMAAYDRDLVQQGAVGLYRGGDTEALRALLFRWAPRNFIPNGHWAIQVAQYLRILEANQWRCPEPVIRHMVYSLATPYDATENPTLWEDGEQGFIANQQRILSVPSGWMSGDPDDSAANELVLAFRDADPESAAQMVADRLSGGLHPQSVWDAILVSRAELILSSPGSGYDEHCVTSVTALYDLYQAAADADTKLVLLLQAAGWYVGGWSSQRDTVLAALSPATPPDDVNEIFASLEPAHQNGSPDANGRMTAAAQTLGWFEDGRAADEFDAAASTIIARKAGGDWHKYKVTVALLENARAVTPAFSARIRAALMLYMRAPSDDDWERYCEVVAAVSDIPAM
jgi:hypothetical protein